MQKFHNNVQNTFGDAVGSVTVTVRTNPGGALATIYSDNALSAKSNPFTNDTDGEFFFYAADGRYDVELTGPVTETQEDIRLLDIVAVANGIVVNTDIVTATPPVAEAVTGSFQIFDLDNTDQLARFGYNGNNTLGVVNLMHGGQVILAGEDAGGIQRTIVSGDPDGSSGLHYVGNVTLAARAAGVGAIVSATSTDTENRYLVLEHADLTDRGYIGFIASADLRLRNVIHGGSVILDGEDAGGTPRTILDGDPDGRTDIMGDTDVHILVNAGAEIAIECVANGKTALRYNAIEKIRSADETASDAASGGEVVDAGGTARYIGFNILPRQNITGSNTTLAQSHQGLQFFYNEASARSLILNNDATIPVDAYFSLRVGPSAGTLTVDGGTGVTLTYWNGTGYTTTAAAANLVAGEGQYTIWKNTDTNYFIDGPNIAP